MLFPCSIRVPPHRWAVDEWTGPGWRRLQRHQVLVAAPPATALDALAGLRLRELPIVRALFTLRRLKFSPEMTLLDFFSTSPFTILETVPGEEIVGGVLIPARSANGVRGPPRTPAEFRLALETAPVAAIASFRADAVTGGSRLASETFVRTRGALPAALFRGYWLAIGPFSAWTRRTFLAAARARIRSAAVGR